MLRVCWSSEAGDTTRGRFDFGQRFSDTNGRENRTQAIFGSMKPGLKRREKSRKAKEKGTCEKSRKCPKVDAAGERVNGIACQPNLLFLHHLPTETRRRETISERLRAFPGF